MGSCREHGISDQEAEVDRRNLEVKGSGILPRKRLVPDQVY